LRPNLLIAHADTKTFTGRADLSCDLVFEGMESLHCVKKEHVDAFIEVVSERISKVKAAELLELYEFARE
jgi:hypothetical protein